MKMYLGLLVLAASFLGLANDGSQALLLLGGLGLLLTHHGYSERREWASEQSERRTPQRQTSNTG